MKKNFDQYFNTEKIKKKRDVFKEILIIPTKLFTILYRVQYIILYNLI